MIIIMILIIISLLFVDFNLCYHPFTFHIHLKSLSLYSVSNDLECNEDVYNTHFVGEWNYYYRKRGMQTTTEDILLAHYGLSGYMTNDTVKYVDLGCGIGSTYLIVSYALLNNNLNSECIGIEAQNQSIDLLKRSLRDIDIKYQNSMKLIHGDIRDKDINLQNVDLITANPPYLPITSGTFPKDSQRRYAHFEFRGGIEDYCLVARKLIRPNSGRFLVTFLASSINRVMRAAQSTGLALRRRVDIITSYKELNNEPSLILFEFYLSTNNYSDFSESLSVDISRDTNTGAISKTYKHIKASLQMRSRPLK